MVDKYILAKVRKNDTEGQAGRSFIPAEKISEQIPSHMLENEEPVFGLYKDTSCWTVLTTSNVVAFNDSSHISISNEVFAELSHDHFLEIGKEVEFEYLPYGDLEIWVHSPAVSSCIMGAIQQIERFNNRQRKNAAAN